MTRARQSRTGDGAGRILRPLSLAAAVLAVLSLVLAPPAEAALFGGVTVKDEREMGRKFDVAIRASLPMVQDPEVTQYVGDLVARIVRAIPPQPYRFKPGVILHNSMNAFAVPGGYVYVFTGLLMNFGSEAQVAGVLCHELAHVTQRHTASRIERGRMVTLGSLLLAVAGVAVGGGGAAAAGALGAGQAAMLGYSRADESEADHIGMQYLVKSGYPPMGMVDGFKILRQKTWMTGQNVPTYLSTHPDLSDRIKAITAAVMTLPPAQRDAKVDDSKFRRMQVLLWGRYGTPQAALRRYADDSALSLMARGMVHSRQNAVGEAAKCFDAAVAKAPGDGLVLREAGIYNYRKGDAEKARDLLTRALKIDPGDYMASFFIARLLDDEGRRKEAQRRFRDVLRAVPDDAEVHETLARSYGLDGDQKLAWIHMTYAAIYSQNKKLAERNFEKAKTADGKSEDFRRLAAVYKERKDIWENL